MVKKGSWVLLVLIHHVVYSRVDEYDTQFSNPKWVEEYKGEEDELAKTANELLGTIDNPKFNNSEVSTCEVRLVIHV